MTQMTYGRDEIVARYVEIRDAIKAKEDVHKAEIAEMKKNLDVIENYLLNEMQSHGETSFSTTAGTAFIKEVTQVSVADKEVYLQFVRQQDDLTFLTVTANKTHVTEWLENTGTIPPGLNYFKRKEIGIRRGKSKE